MFETSIGRAAPAEFSLSRIFPGASEGLQLMVVGEKRRFWIPAALAYDGQPGHPRGTLVFDVEMLAITRLHRPDAVPTDLTPPSNAECTTSGLCTRVARASRGGERPGPGSRVRIRFSSWSADGRALDNTTSTGEDASLQIDAVMPGLREGLQMMRVGETRRLWIPAALASGTGVQGGGRAVVYDIDLVAIDPP